MLEGVAFRLVVVDWSKERLQTGIEVVGKNVYLQLVCNRVVGTEWEQPRNNDVSDSLQEWTTKV